MRPFNSEWKFSPTTAESQLRRVAVQSAGITLLGQAASFGVQIASVMVLARLLTPNDFGLVTMVTTFSLLFRSFGLNGFTELVIQREDITHFLASNLFWIQLGIGVLLTAIFAGSGRLIASFYHNPAVAPVVRGMSLTIGIGCLGWIHMGLLQRAMAFRAIAVINFAGQLSLVLVSIVLALAGLHYWALVWGSVTQTVVVAVGTWLVCRWLPSLPRKVDGTASGLAFAMNVYSHFAFAYWTRNTDNLLVGWRYGAQSLGFYKKAYDLFVLAENQLLSPISAVAVSTLSRVSSDREQFQRYFVRAISVLALIGMGVGADFALVGRDLIRFLLGPGWEEAGKIFALFGPGVGVMLLYATQGWLHLSIGRPDRWFRWGFMEFVFNASLFLLALHWGPSAIALAWTVSYFLLMLPGFWYAGKPIGLGVGPLFAVIWRFFLASIAASFGTVLVIRYVSPVALAVGSSVAFVKMCLVSLLFFGEYALAVVVLHKGIKPIAETVELLHDLLPERRASEAVAAAVSDQ